MKFRISSMLPRALSRKPETKKKICLKCLLYNSLTKNSIQVCLSVVHFSYLILNIVKTDVKIKTPCLVFPHCLLKELDTSKDYLLPLPPTRPTHFYGPFFELFKAGIPQKPSSTLILQNSWSSASLGHPPT